MEVATTLPNWTPTCGPRPRAMIVTVVPTFPELGVMETTDGCTEGGTLGGTEGGVEGGNLGGSEGGVEGGVDDVPIVNRPQSSVFPEVGSRIVTCPLVAPTGTIAVIWATPGAGMLTVACAVSVPNLTVMLLPTFLA